MLKMLAPRSIKKHSFTLIALTLLLCSMWHAVQSASVYVPHIKQRHYDIRPNNNNGYILRVNLPNGSKMIERGAFNETTQTLQRFGRMRQVFPDTKGVLTVHYIADEHGYRVRYNYTTVPKTPQQMEEEAIEFDSRLDVTSLKTLGG